MISGGASDFDRKINRKDVAIFAFSFHSFSLFFMMVLATATDGAVGESDGIFYVA